MATLTFTSLGGADTVTGSEHMVQLGARRTLVDCGLFRGLKPLRLKNWEPFPIDPGSQDAVALLHAHLDHSGYLPQLVREGLQGKVFCSSATRRIIEINLRNIEAFAAGTPQNLMSAPA